MAKKHANKKPRKKTSTNASFGEFKLITNTMENMMSHMHKLEDAIYNLSSAMQSYMEFKGDIEEWKKWVNDKVKKHQEKKEKDDKSGETAGDSNTGTKEDK